MNIGSWCGQGLAPRPTLLPKLATDKSTYLGLSGERSRHALNLVMINSWPSVLQRRLYPDPHRHDTHSQLLYWPLACQLCVYADRLPEW